MRTKATLLIFALIAACIGLAVPTAEAQSSPVSVVIVGEGMKGADISVPVGFTTRIRLEGRDAQGRNVRLDPAKITWSTTSSNGALAGKKKDGSIYVTALKDAFDRPNGKEPTATLTGRYGRMSASVTVSAVPDVRGKWVIHSGDDIVTIDIVRQSGRWIVDSNGQRGAINDRRMNLHIWADLKFPLGKTELWPVVHFTSRTEGSGGTSVPIAGWQTFTIVKQP